MPVVTQEWTHQLSFMKQSVLLCALRGPDGIHKNHISKKLLRWMRRCVLISAFDGEVLTRPFDVDKRRGGSFTGPSLSQGRWPGEGSWQRAMDTLVDEYMLTLDEIPHHFQLHFLHAAEIIGYCHPADDIALWWRVTYVRLCHDMHLLPETPAAMNERLSDYEELWRAHEEVRAD